MERPPIYLDYHATSPVDPAVLEAMLPALRDAFGNAASPHAFGRRAAGLVDAARESVATALGGDPREVVFTSGATEAINLAIKGCADARPAGRHIVTCRTEHRAVLDVCERLERGGFEVTYLPVEADGRVSPDAVRDALRDDTTLLSLMHANNEIGAVHPIAAIGRIAKERGVLFHLDAAQSLAWLPVRVEDLGVDLVSLSGHKICGPKGVGALWVRRRAPRVRLTPQLDGGGHERGRRSGTLDVPGIVGLGAACRIVESRRARDAGAARELRDHLLTLLRSSVPDLCVNGGLSDRLPGNLNVTVPGVDARRIADALEDVAVSAGSACSTGSATPSHVLAALSAEEPRVRGGLRVGIGRFTTRDEIDEAARRITAAIDRIRLEPALPEGAACETECGPPPVASPPLGTSGSPLRNES